jgi:hypothetical protein
MRKGERIVGGRAMDCSTKTVEKMKLVSIEIR